MPNIWEDNALYTHYKVSTVSGQPLETINGLSIPDHDYIGLTYTSGNVTGVEYREGGQTGTVVATLVLSYDGNNNLISVEKT